MARKSLSDNQKMIDEAEASIKAVNARKRKLIEQSKIIVYDNLVEIYFLEGEQLIDTIAKEHEIIKNFLAGGMTYEKIEQVSNSYGVHRLDHNNQ